MISSPRDGNRVVAVMATSSADGQTPIVVKVSPTLHEIQVNDALTGSGFPSVNAQRDANRIPVLWGLSDANNGTIIPIYADSVTGNLLIRST